MPRLSAPLFAPKFGIPNRNVIDGRLVGGAVLFGLVLLVAMARILRNKANAQPMVMPTVNLPDDDPEEDEFDFDDLDDLDDDLDDDFDDVFADL